jgi:PAS domain S-box-containing protein
MPNAVLIDALFRIDENVVVLNNDFVIVYANQAFAEHTCLKESELLGKNVLELIPDDLSIIREELIQARDKRETKRFEWKSIDSALFFETTIFPSENGLTIISRDITERKNAEEKLRLSEEKYRVLFEQAGDYILVLSVSKEGVPIIRDANYSALKVHGYSREELIGKPLSIIDKTVSLERMKFLFREILAGKHLFFEVVHWRKDGTTFNAEVSAGPIKVGSETWMLTIERDITERKRIEKELMLYQKHLEELVEKKTVQLKKIERLAAIGETAGMVGHDIRNPLQAMVGDTYLLKGYLTEMPESQTKKQVKESLDSIENNISYINKIIADLQDYSRSVNPEYINLNLNDLIINVLESITVPANIDVVFEIGSAIRLKSDPTLITRILTNLIINAIQAMPNGGKLIISDYRIGNKVSIKITDTGMGISQHVKAQLFTPMFTTKAKGQGLGLAVAKRLVEALKGKISFESQEGKGTTFTIILPSNHAS